MVLRVSSLEYPLYNKIFDGSTLIELHALPAETATPIWSKISTADCAERFLNVILRVFDEL